MVDPSKSPKVRMNLIRSLASSSRDTLERHPRSRPNTRNEPDHSASHGRGGSSDLQPELGDLLPGGLDEVAYFLRGGDDAVADFLCDFGDAVAYFLGDVGDPVSDLFGDVGDGVAGFFEGASYFVEGLLEGVADFGEDAAFFEDSWDFSLI